MSYWLDYIIVLIIGALIPTLLLIGNWPVENTFRNATTCTVLALQNLQGEPDLNLNRVYIEARKVNKKRKSRRAANMQEDHNSIKGETK